LTSVLSREDISQLLNQNPPIVDGLQSLEEQLQPNGIDLTVSDVSLFGSSGILNIQNNARVLSSTSPLIFSAMGCLDLVPGCYLITYNETVNLPRNIMGLAFPRSSLLRCGISIHTAVWDAGYSGRGQSLMLVYNTMGFRVYQYARVVQLVFFRLNRDVIKGYDGVFQKENL
jgi:dUTP pyrophosphatase